VIENWQSEDGQRAIGIMGPPSWGFEYRPPRWPNYPTGYTAEREVRAAQVGTEKCWVYDVYGRDIMKSVPGEWEHIHSLDAEEAVKHYRDAARGWLVAKYRDVDFKVETGNCEGGVWVIEVWAAAAYRDDYEVLANAPDYDKALIAAILAGAEK